MDPVKKCNTIWGICFAVMTILAIAFLALFVRRTQEFQALAVLCGGSAVGSMCKAIPTVLCSTVPGCKVEDGACTNA